jgi:hypothetical protein
MKKSTQREQLSPFTFEEQSLRQTHNLEVVRRKPSFEKRRFALPLRMPKIRADKLFPGDKAAIGGEYHVRQARLRLDLLDVARQDADVVQHVAQAALGDADRKGRGAAAAAELGSDEDLAAALSLGVEHAEGVEFQHDHGVGRVEGLHGRRAARLQVGGVRQAMAGRVGHELQRLAARVQVDDDVGQRQQCRGDVVGDLLGDGAVRRAGEQAVQVAAVDRRGALAGADRRVIHHRQQDDPAGDL